MPQTNNKPNNGNIKFDHILQSTLPDIYLKPAPSGPIQINKLRDKTRDNISDIAFHLADVALGDTISITKLLERKELNFERPAKVFKVHHRNMSLLGSFSF